MSDIDVVFNGTLAGSSLREIEATDFIFMDRMFRNYLSKFYGLADYSDILVLHEDDYFTELTVEGIYKISSTILQAYISEEYEEYALVLACVVRYIMGQLPSLKKDGHTIALVDGEILGQKDEEILQKFLSSDNNRIIDKGKILWIISEMKKFGSFKKLKKFNKEL